MLKRVLSAVVLLALVAVCFGVSRITAVLLVAVCVSLCCYELARSQKKQGRNPVGELSYVMIAVCAAVIYFKLSFIWVAAVVSVLFLAAFLICMYDKKRTALDALLTLGMLIYPCLPAVGIIYACTLESYKWLVVMLTGLLSAVSCDSFALFGGMAFGRHKLAPEISPKKTIEGSISGMVVTVGVAAGAWFLFNEYIACNLWLYMLTAFVCTITSQIGDLAASFIKREAGIKDFSNLIPGHGGMLDRIDSIILSIPTAFVLLTLFKGI